MSYTHSLTVAQPYARALELVRSALAEQGFGILSEIDVRATFEAKLGPAAAEELGDYTILGACNPPLARRALAAEPELGALLPCNVVVRRKPTEDTTIVEAIDPQTMVQLSGTPAVREIAEDADSRLRSALSALREGDAAGEAV
ncbi:DUF302 domain-containing protein [Sinomonas humi]|uniref:ABC transporter n=1 Tax=Sinomonas humi TaxID=1338436 RepID=A0A0B2ASI3_9MICC|nr:DUF302 domain-containing protein [Sinomonas humi]KHL04854.1 ABC transporter [Sinomonas humi]